MCAASQMAEVAVPRESCAAILGRIALVVRLAAPPGGGWDPQNTWIRFRVAGQWDVIAMRPSLI